ncbi:Protein-lysine N-methyltransferase EFM2 [Pseudozyma hubeiensis]|nr:Protein-lysine N-methyltransferase EFM2 [Pseudozyma hubeiensis]
MDEGSQQHRTRCMSVEPGFLPSRDLRSLKSLDLASSECLDSVRSNLDSLAHLLGASGGRILHAPPQLVQSRHQPSEASEANEPAVEHPPAPVDAFEKNYVARWLSRLISDLTLATPHDDDAASLAEQLSERCAALLAIAAGKMAAGASTQKHVFHFDHQPLEVDLRDAALVHDSLGTHTWGAAPILSQLLLHREAQAARDLNVLELGAGTGLVGLALAAWARRHRDAYHTRIMCTDYHPTVLDNLQHNITLNGWSAPNPAVHGYAPEPPSVSVSAHCLDWQSVHRARIGHTSGQQQQLTSQTLPDHHLVAVSASASSWLEPFDVEAHSGVFDLLLAADCVYDPVHPSWIRSVAEKLLKRPDASLTNKPLLHIMVPLRPTHQQEVQAVYRAFQSQPGVSGPQLNILCEQDYQGYENFGAWNAVVRSDSSSTSQPEGGLARTYRWFQIGWHE